MAVLSFRSYGYSPDPVRVMSERITHFYSIDYNGDHGTVIVLDTGVKIRVGEWSSDVQKRIEDAQGKGG